MKALVVTGNKLRHTYFANIMSENFEVVGMASEHKRNYYTDIQESSLIIRTHFDNLTKYEKEYFSRFHQLPDAELLDLSCKRINDEDVIDWAIAKQPDVVLLFGTNILNNRWLNNFPQRIINLHLGLSPFYRGSATLFWPFYNNELECLGTTIHLAIEKVDAGAIIERIKPSFDENDNYYMITNKLIKKSIQLIPRIVKKYFEEFRLTAQDISLGKVYKRADFTEKSLIQVHKIMSDGLKKEKILQIQSSELCNC